MGVSADGGMLNLGFTSRGFPPTFSQARFVTIGNATKIASVVRTPQSIYGTQTDRGKNTRTTYILPFGTVTFRSLSMAAWPYCLYAARTTTADDGRGGRCWWPDAVVIVRPTVVGGRLSAGGVAARPRRVGRLRGRVFRRSDGCATATDGKRAFERSRAAAASDCPGGRVFRGGAHGPVSAARARPPYVFAHGET